MLHDDDRPDPRQRVRSANDTAGSIHHAKHRAKGSPTRCQNTRSSTTYLLEQLAYNASDLGDETRGDAASGVVQRCVAGLPRGDDEGGVLAEAARQAGIRKPRFVRARLP